MTSTLQEKLDSTIANSQVFKLLSEVEQAGFITSLEGASDDQIARAITVLEENEQIYLQNEQNKLNQAQNLIAAAEQLNQEIKAADKLIAQKDEADDQAKDLQQLQSMEEAIAEIDTSLPPGKTK